MRFYPHHCENYSPSCRFSPRADVDDSLIARELVGLDLLAREYLSAALVARMERPEREHFRTLEEYEKAWRAWNRRNGRMSHELQHTIQKHDPGRQPQREHYGSHAEYDAAWRKWSKDSRKVAHSMKKSVDKHTAKGAKEQHKLAQKAEKKKKPGFFARLFGKKRKSKRDLMYVFDE